MFLVLAGPIADTHHGRRAAAGRRWQEGGGVGAPLLACGVDQLQTLVRGTRQGHAVHVPAGQANTQLVTSHMEFFVWNKNRYIMLKLYNFRLTY